MFFERQDPISNQILREFGKLEAENPDFNAISTQTSYNLIRSTAIGLYQQKLRPDNLRGYLTAYDALYALGFDGDSLKMLDLYPNMHILKLKRLFSRYKDICAYHKIRKLLQDNQELVFNEITKDKSFASEIKGHLNNVYDGELLKLFFNEAQPDPKAYLSISNIQIEQHLKQEDYIVLSEYFYRCFWNGYHELDFLKQAIQPFKNELDTSNRVIFFRQVAQALYPYNLEFLNLSLHGLLLKSEVSEAYRLLKETLARQQYNDEILYHYIRINVLLGKDLNDFALYIQQADVSDNIKEYISYHLLARYYLTNNEAEFNRIEQELLSIGKKHPLSAQLHDLLNEPVEIPTSKPAKVALCISGQMRGIDVNAENLVNRFVKPLNAKVFISTWDKQIFSPPRFNRLYRFLGNELTKLLPKNMSMPSLFYKYLPKSHKKLTTPLFEEVSREYLLSFFNHAVIQIDDERQFNKTMEKDHNFLKVNRTFNQAKMFYKNYRCQHLLEDYSKLTNDKFDVIIRCRPDLDITLPNLPELIENARQNPFLLYVHYISQNGIGDQFAIGSTRAMKLYTMVWEKLLEARAIHYDPSLDPRVALGAENLLAAHLMIAGLNVKIIKPRGEVTLLTPLAINHIDIIEELKADMENLDNPEVLKPFFDKYLSVKQNNGVFK